MSEFVARGAQSRRSAFVAKLFPTGLVRTEQRGWLHSLMLSTRAVDEKAEGADFLVFENQTADDFTAALALIKVHGAMRHTPNEGGTDA